MIIGQNNVGKSNVINFLSSQYPHFLSKAKGERTFGQEKKNTFNDIDHPISSTKISHRISFPIFEDEIDDYISKKISGKGSQFANKEHLKKLLTSRYFADEDGIIWFTYKADNPNGDFSLELNIDEIIPLLDGHQWQSLWSSLTGQGQGDLKQHWVPQTIKVISFTPDFVPNVEIIPAIRKIEL